MQQCSNTVGCEISTSPSRYPPVDFNVRFTHTRSPECTKMLQKNYFNMDRLISNCNINPSNFVKRLCRSWYEGYSNPQESSVLTGEPENHQSHEHLPRRSGRYPSPSPRRTHLREILINYLSGGR